MMASIIRRAAGSDDPEHVEAWVVSQRLEPMVFGLELPDIAVRPEFMASCRESYLRMSARAVQFRAAGDLLVAELVSAGIPAVAWRGVWYGERCYGDPGLRYATDIDVMVSPADARPALSILSSRGCRLRNHLFPSWYLRRHHLHWPLQTAQGGIPVDVHWAVDHPYRNSRCTVDVAGLAKPDGQLQAAVHHAEKESRLRDVPNRDAWLRRILYEGPVLPWIDLALLWDGVSGAEREALAGRMRREGLGVLWDRAEAVVDWLKDPTQPAPVRFAEGSGGRMTSSAALALAEAVGCRAEALADWVEYTEGGSLGHRALRWMRVGRLVVDTAVCLPWVAWRRWAGRHHGAVCS